MTADATRAGYMAFSETVKALMDRDEARAVEVYHNIPHCPSCQATLDNAFEAGPLPAFCPACGQRLDWRTDNA